jgi:hypothetical protein
MYGVLRLVALEYPFQALIQVHPRSRRSHEEVRQDEGVKELLTRPIELDQLVDQTSLVRLVLSSGVEGNQGDQCLRCAGQVQEEGSVDRVHPCLVKHWRVADVVQPGGAHDERRIGPPLHAATGHQAHGPHMLPAIARRLEELTGHGLAVGHGPGHDDKSMPDGKVEYLRRAHR